MTTVEFGVITELVRLNQSQNASFSPPTTGHWSKWTWFDNVDTLIAAFGIIINLMFLYVFSRGSKRLANINVNWFSVNLAVADLIFLVTVLVDQLIKRFSSPNFNYETRIKCILLNAFLYIPVHVSMISIVFIAVDRYIAVCKPFLSKRLQKTPYRPQKFVASSWTIAIVLFIFLPVSCMLQGPEYKTIQNIVTIIYVGPTFLCTVLISCFYATIIFKFRKRKRRASAKDIKVKIQEDSHRVTRMLMVTTLAFFICILPYEIHMFYGTGVDVQLWEELGHPEQWLLFEIPRLLWFLHSAINPIIYNAMSERHRQAFAKCFSVRRRAEHKSNNSCSQPYTAAASVEGSANGVKTSSEILAVDTLEIAEKHSPTNGNTLKVCCEFDRCS